MAIDQTRSVRRYVTLPRELAEQLDALAREESATGESRVTLSHLVVRSARRMLADRRSKAEKRP